MSRTLRKAVENAKQKKETEINLVEEGIAHLEEVPELFILHNLTKLCLSHNKIVELPPEIVELRSLEYLNLFNNHLEDLPSTISALPRLRELNLALNRLCELPRGFGSFPALEILDLTYNNLVSSSFSANFAYLGGCLRALYMGDNDLKHFPPHIDKFTLLEVLVLRDNAIVEVPKELGKCIKLKTLHLQGNQIMAVPLELGRLKVYGEQRSFRLGDNPLVTSLDEKVKAGNVKIFFDFLTTEEYNLIYLRFLDRHEPETIKRDKSGKKCRKTQKHKVPALKYETK
jgi:Leucine-rich repeat (LRR) protein